MSRNSYARRRGQTALAVIVAIALCGLFMVVGTSSATATPGNGHGYGHSKSNGQAKSHGKSGNSGNKHSQGKGSSSDHSGGHSNGNSNDNNGQGHSGGSSNGHSTPGSSSGNGHQGGDAGNSGDHSSSGGGQSDLAHNNDQVCSGLDSGKIDVSGSTGSITVTAPEGKLIDGYCVKAGSVQNGNGPSYHEVDPPQQTITITYPSGKDISHYSVSYADVSSPDDDQCPDGTNPGDTDGDGDEDADDCSSTPPPPTGDQYPDGTSPGDVDGDGDEDADDCDVIGPPPSSSPLGSMAVNCKGVVTVKLDNRKSTVERTYYLQHSMAPTAAQAWAFNVDGGDVRILTRRGAPGDIFTLSTKNKQLGEVTVPPKCSEPPTNPPSGPPTTSTSPPTTPGQSVSTRLPTVIAAGVAGDNPAGVRSAAGNTQSLGFLIGMVLLLSIGLGAALWRRTETD